MAQECLQKSWRFIPPSSHYPGALAYICERRVGLSVYRGHPEVSIDTNHLERALRVIPMGKKN
jgi:transposase